MATAIQDALKNINAVVRETKPKSNYSEVKAKRDEKRVEDRAKFLAILKAGEMEVYGGKGKARKMRALNEAQVVEKVLQAFGKGATLADVQEAAPDLPARIDWSLVEEHILAAATARKIDPTLVRAAFGLDEKVEEPAKPAKRRRSKTK